MTAIAPCLQAFFTERLAQRQSSPNTVASYRDALRLLVCYLHQTTGVEPSRLDFADLDADRVSAFLDHLEAVRHVSVSTRNAASPRFTRCSGSPRYAIPNTSRRSHECWPSHRNGPTRRPSAT